jgi:hypothetical protein
MSTLIQSVARGLRWTVRFVATLMRTLFGELQWSPPPWIGRTATVVRDATRRISQAVAASHGANPRRFRIATNVGTACSREY